MTFFSQTRALVHAALSVELRSRVAIVALGGVIGLSVGAAYLGGEAVQAATLRAKVDRLQEAEALGYSPDAMAQAAGGLDASAMAIANRHDPYALSGSATRDRQAEHLTARLDEIRTKPQNPAARPFSMANALDQSRDLDCLTRAAYYEARGEGAAGMKAVTQVVLNRVRHPAFPKTICGVVYQGSNRATGCQFSFTCNGATRGNVNRASWNRAREIASQALAGQVYAGVGNATHFHTTGVSPSWRHSLVKVGQVGDHLFYRFGGRNGSSDAFNRTPKPSSSGEARLISASLSEAANTSGPVPYQTVAHFDAAKADEAAATVATPQTTPSASSSKAPSSASPSRGPAPVTATATAVAS